MALVSYFPRLYHDCRVSVSLAVAPLPRGFPSRNFIDVINGDYNERVLAALSRRVVVVGARHARVILCVCVQNSSNCANGEVVCSLAVQLHAKSGDMNDPSWLMSELFNGEAESRLSCLRVD